MAFDKKSFSEVYESLVADTQTRLPELDDFEEGSVIRSLFETVGYELALLYEKLDLVYQAGFVDTAQGSHLDRVVAVLGVTRNEPDFATGVVTFERDPGQDQDIVIPIGTLVTTQEGDTQKPAKKAYVTTEEGQLGEGEERVEVKVQAVEPGDEMVTDAATVLIMPSPVPGIKSVLNRLPIHFQGRDEETDEELRERAKQVLLVAGRASETSIEQALLGMPGVREVRVREDAVRFKLTQAALDSLKDAKIPESILKKLRDLQTQNKDYLYQDDFEADVKKFLTSAEWNEYHEKIVEQARSATHLGLGVIEIYVDGLNSDNATRVQERIDEVRAAGVYVHLKPAVTIHVEAVLRIEVEVRITGEERLQVERQAREAVEVYLQRRRMGQPLVLSQLSGELLKTPGVTDLLDFTLETYTDTFAEGQVTLQRASNGAQPRLSIPLRTPIQTKTGQEFVLIQPETREDSVTLKEGQPEAQASIQAVQAGRAGQLWRTGAVWQPMEIENTTLSIRNDEPIQLVRTLYAATTKRIDATVFERFVPASIRVAADPKDLSVDVQVHVRFPDRLTREAMLQAIQAQVETLAQTLTQEIYDITAELTDTARDRILNTLKAFLTQVKNDATALTDTLVVALDKPIHIACVTAIQTYFEQLNAKGVRLVKQDKIEQRLQQQLTDMLTADTKRTQERLTQRLTQVLEPFWEQALQTFPDVQLEQDLREEIQRRFTSPQAPGEPSGQGHIAVIQDLVLLAAQLQAASDKVEGQIMQLKTTIQTALTSLSVADIVGKSAEGLAPSTSEIHVRLRVEPFQNAILVDIPQINASFVEKPVSGMRFIYTDRLELTGTLQLALVPAAQKQDVIGVIGVIGAVRQALEEYLDSLQPQEAVSLDTIRQRAEEHEQVSAVTFEPQACGLVRVVGERRARFDRGHDGKTIAIHFGEKVFLSVQDFSIDEG